MGKFIITEDWFSFLVYNREKVEQRDFRKVADDNFNAIKKYIPKGSQEHLELKQTFDKKYFPVDAPRGVYYPYLVKVCSGFASVWQN